MAELLEERGLNQKDEEEIEMLFKRVHNNIERRKKIIEMTVEKEAQPFYTTLPSKTLIQKLKRLIFKFLFFPY